MNVIIAENKACAIFLNNIGLGPEQSPQANADDDNSSPTSQVRSVIKLNADRLSSNGVSSIGIYSAVK